MLPEPSILQAEPSHLSQILLAWQKFQLLHYLCGLFWIYSSKSMYWGAHGWTKNARWGLIWASPSLICWPWTHYWFMFNFVSLAFFLWKDSFQPVGPSMYWCLGLLLTSCRTLHFSFWASRDSCQTSSRACWGSSDRQFKPLVCHPLLRVLYYLQACWRFSLSYHPGH